MLLIALALSWFIHMLLVERYGSVYFVEERSVILWAENHPDGGDNHFRSVRSDRPGQADWAKETKRPGRGFVEKKRTIENAMMLLVAEAGAVNFALTCCR